MCPYLLRGTLPSLSCLTGMVSMATISKPRENLCSSETWKGAPTGYRKLFYKRTFIQTNSMKEFSPSRGNNLSKRSHEADAHSPAPVSSRQAQSSWGLISAFGPSASWVSLGAICKATGIFLLMSFPSLLFILVSAQTWLFLDVQHSLREAVHAHSLSNKLTPLIMTWIHSWECWP